MRGRIKATLTLQRSKLCACVCVCLSALSITGVRSKETLLSLEASAFFILHSFNYSKWKYMKIPPLSYCIFSLSHLSNFSASISLLLCCWSRPLSPPLPLSLSFSSSRLLYPPPFAFLFSTFSLRSLSWVASLKSVTTCDLSAHPSKRTHVEGGEATGAYLKHTYTHILMYTHTDTDTHSHKPIYPLPSCHTSVNWSV